jgi:hypothetical protein
MTSGRIGCELAVLAVLSVVTIFLFPAIHGPYSAVYGPATSLQSQRVAHRLWNSIVQAARSRSWFRVLLLWCGLVASESIFSSVETASLSAVLRC